MAATGLLSAQETDPRIALVISETQDHLGFSCCSLDHSNHILAACTVFPSYRKLERSTRKGMTPHNVNNTCI